VSKAPPETPTQPTPEQEVLTIEQWAAEQSRTDRRVEMLTAFAMTERAAGRFCATRTDWNAAYAAFAARPL